MSRCASIGLAATVLLAACVVGPKYTPDVVIRPTERIGVSRTSDSARVFFESIAWLEILRDSALVQLVDVALRQNKNLRLAEARIREFRATLGTAKAPLVPSVAINGAESTNQIALGAFPPTSYRAARVTSDLAWELDFWGRIRGGVHAAQADLESQEAGERA